MIHIRLLIATAAASLLMACAGMPGAGDTSIQARVADTLQVADAIVSTTRTLLAANAISPDNATSVAKAALVARDGASAVLALAAKECPASGAPTSCVPTGANARLRLVADGLDQLKLYLATPGVK